MGLAIKPKIMLKFLKYHGFKLDRIKGSHHMMTDGKREVPVPVHKEDLKTGTLQSILELSGLTKKQLKEWLGRE